MAAIDKTYVTAEQWVLGQQFINETYEQQLTQIKFPINLYEQSSGVLWNTSFIQDLWLKKFCPLDFIQERLREQYGDGLDVLSNIVNFSSFGIAICSIQTPTYTVDLCEPDGEHTVSVFDDADEILVYGTTLFLKVLHDSVDTLCGFPKLKDVTIIFDYFGTLLTYKNGKFFNDDREVGLGYLYNELFVLPKINYSFDSFDILKYNKYKIIFSDDNEICSLADYEDCNFDIQKGIKYGRFAIPQYITKMLK